MSMSPTISVSTEKILAESGPVPLGPPRFSRKIDAAPKRAKKRPRCDSSRTDSVNPCAQEREGKDVPGSDPVVAVESREASQKHADEDRDAYGHKAHGHGDPRPLEHARENVPA